MMTRLICRVFGHKRIVVPIGDRPLEYAGEIVGFEKDASVTNSVVGQCYPVTSTPES